MNASPSFLDALTPAVRAPVAEVARLTAAAGGRALLAGGCVRDALLGRPVQDADIEVYGLPAERLQTLLGRHFGLDLVGRAFAVIKLKGLPVDIALPRRESKQGAGHKGFLIESDPNLDFPTATARRDFTINAILADPVTNDVIDPWHGRQDLARGILRHVSAHFIEDPLRVLRAMQFLARFEFDAAPETVRLCATITPEGLPSERLFDEWRKLLLAGRRPSRGLRFLRECGWLRYYPELLALVDCPQDPEWHPEGDVWNHTLRCLDAFARRREGAPHDDLVVGLAVLCHDLGKPATTRRDDADGRWRSIGHDSAGEASTRAFLAHLTNQRDVIEPVVKLVLAHMRPQDLFRAQAGDAAIRRLARQVGRLDWLARVDAADRRGRSDDYDEAAPAADRWLIEQAVRLAVSDAAPKPILLGRHLMALGLPPGPRFGALLKACYEAQLEGAVKTVEDGLAFILKRISRPG